jgi:molybdate transport system permease protein
MDLEPLWLTLQVGAGATILTGIVGLAVAALLANVRFPGREVLDVLFTAPLVLPPTVLGYFLLVGLGRRSTIGHVYEAITGSPIVFTKTGAIVAAAVSAIPFVVRFGRAAFEGVDPVLVQAARTLGAGPVRAFFTIQLPLARRGVVAALMLAFAKSLGDFGVTLMVAGDIPHETQTAALAIYDAIQGQRESDAMALVALQTAAGFVMLYVANLLTRPPERGARR